MGDVEPPSTDQFSNEILTDVFQELHSLVVDNYPPVIDSLFSARVIGARDMIGLQHVINPLDQCRQLLISLHKTKNPRAFIELRQAINKDSTYDWLVEKIDERYKVIAKAAAVRQQVTRERSSPALPPLNEKNTEMNFIDEQREKLKLVEEERDELRREIASLTKENKRLLKENTGLKSTFERLRFEESTAGKSTMNIAEKLTENTLQPFETSHKVEPIIVHTLVDRSGSVDAIAVMDEELFATRYGVRYVLVYDTRRLQLKRKISIPRLGPKLFGLAACPLNKFLFISDWDNDCVHRVDLSTDKNVKITCWKIATRPLALSLTSKHNILVTCYCSPLKKIQEYTPTGMLVRELSHDNDIWQAVGTSNDTLLVSLCYTIHDITGRCDTIHGIAEVKWDGQVMRCYGNKSGSGPGQMNDPRSLAVTSNGIVLVADKDNTRIQVLDSSLTTSRTLPIPEDITLNAPVALCYDESRGRLFVGERNCEHVLVFDHVTNLSVLFSS